ncbi:MAG: aldehyde dehydrogenase family protein [Proteobacteria bacterium]|nr:aldehyde dehydrogenase family protein [Pseudomonadota bacterium]
MDAIVTGPEVAVDTSLSSARAASLRWRDTPVRARLEILRRARRLLAAGGLDIARTLGDRRPVADTLTAELLPLLAAMRFLERSSERLLAPRRLRGGRPLWMVGIGAEIRREPCGVVLIIGPSNYPLFLPGVQMLQALAAGNAVCLKPAPGCAAPIEALAAILTEAGLPEGVLQLLQESVPTGNAAVGAGFDRIVLTGSAETGRAVLAAAAPTLTPATMELSGNDAMLVLPGADIAVVAAALAYGLRLNSGATCIAPRRVFVTRGEVEPLARALLAHVEGMALSATPPGVAARLGRLVAEAVEQGARLLPVPSAPGATAPVLLTDARAEMRLLQEDVFAPWLALVPVDSMAEAITALHLCPYALGVSVFGPEAEARRLAARVRAGSVCINDLIMPTADPRLPFGGRGLSGFGVTRGAEGLLEMTVVKTVSIRRGRFRPHLAPPRSGDAHRYAALIAILYAGPFQAFRLLRRGSE